MSHEGSVGGKPAELFLSRVSPKKVPPLLLQPATLNPNLSTVRPPLRTSPKVESLQPRIPPSAALFSRRFFVVICLTAPHIGRVPAPAQAAGAAQRGTSGAEPRIERRGDRGTGGSSQKRADFPFSLAVPSGPPLRVAHVTREGALRVRLGRGQGWECCLEIPFSSRRRAGHLRSVVPALRAPARRGAQVVAARGASAGVGVPAAA